MLQVDDAVHVGNKRKLDGTIATNKKEEELKVPLISLNLYSGGGGGASG